MFTPMIEIPIQVNQREHTLNFSHNFRILQNFSWQDEKFKKQRNFNFFQHYKDNRWKFCNLNHDLCFVIYSVSMMYFSLC